MNARPSPERASREASPAEAPLSAVATGRTGSLFAADIDAARAELAARVSGRRILAVGAAGSIGSSTVTVLAGFAPAALHVVDQNENELAELVRRLRSRPGGLDVASFHTLPLDYGSPALRAFLHSEAPYDLVLNFAAIKHVRSEKDAFSTLQMFDTNLRKQALLLSWLKEVGFAGRYFSVSTDKAANPTSMMGASKRAMEHVMFDDEVTRGLTGEITSARFANVAFSNGSLLQSFERRLARGEPLAAPRDTRRYFVSLEESGEICTLAAVMAPHRCIVIPKLDPQAHLVPLEDVAARFLRRHGFEPGVYDDEEMARENVGRERARGRWPLLLTPLDTSGEKPYEEFVGEGEELVEIGLPNLTAVRYRPAPPGRVSAMLAEIDRFFAPAAGAAPPVLDKDVLKNMIGAVEPGFLRTHRDTGRSLDQRI
jgi:FlaA1/EpsC-like NDP-sugar epimerase